MTGQHKAPTGAGARTDAGNVYVIGLTASTVRRSTDTLAPAPDYRRITSLWARTRVQALTAGRSVPAYGSPDWHQLPEQHPRRLAALIVAAEQSRTAGPTVLPLQRSWHRDPRPVRATPGWPPVAVPGLPGAFLAPPAGQVAA